MRYVRIFNDEHGQARFEDGETTFSPEVYAPPGPPLDVSAAITTRDMRFIRFSAGWTDAAHPAPARQWMFVLSGRGESTAGGETRAWGPGSVFLVEDTAPPGHGTTIFEEAILAVVRC